jgi:hypothetical protein
MATTEAATYVLDVDADLLDHASHLPETIECFCGYHR